MELPKGRTLPFNSETARIAQAKSVAARKAAEPLRQIKFAKTMEQRRTHPHSKPVWAEIALMRRGLRNCLQQSIAATDVPMMALAVQSAVEVFNMEQRLLGRDILPVKSKSKRSKAMLSPHDLPMPDPVSCGVAPTLPSDASGSGVCGVDTSDAQSASGQATVAPVDDTPF